MIHVFSALLTVCRFGVLRVAPPAVASFAVVLAFAIPATTTRAVAQTSLGVTGDVRLERRVKTFKDFRDERVVRQAFDYSCGAAALATLMTYEVGASISETDVIAGMVATLDARGVDLRERDGFSLLDMKNFVELLGFRADGFRLGPEALAKVKGAVIVYIQPRGYDHFAVFKGVRRGRVHLADPARGNVRLSLAAFEKMWLDEDGKGVVFVADWRREGAAASAFRSSLAPEPTPFQDAEVLSARQLIQLGPRPPL
ncbi:MAG: C39 family peptidase [Pseudomonadota bacterium]